jgi:hypothetical protein
MTSPFDLRVVKYAAVFVTAPMSYSEGGVAGSGPVSAEFDTCRALRTV